MGILWREFCGGYLVASSYIVASILRQVSCDKYLVPSILSQVSCGWEYGLSRPLLNLFPSGNTRFNVRIGPLLSAHEHGRMEDKE